MADAAPTPFRRLRAAGIALTLILLFALAFGLRRHVYLHQTPLAGGPLPFTLESAIQYRAIRTLFSGEALPRHDAELGWPEGVHTFAYDTVGSEYVFAALARLFPRTLTLSERVRILNALWFSLGIPLLAWAVRRRTGHWPGGFAAAALYAVGLGGLIRSTGHELSHENFALPLWIAHLALLVPPPEGDGSARRATLRRIASAVLLALAMMSWDLIQLCAGAWLLARAVSFLRAPRPAADPWWRDTLYPIAGLVAAGLIHPYLRSHGFLLSPGMALAAGLVAGAIWMRRTEHAARPAVWAARGLFVLAAAAVVSAAWGYLDHYGHFAELLAAKLRHFNVKPENPALLTFAQRILWTPALDSADLFLVRTFFPYLGPLTALAAVVLGVAAARGDARARRALPWLLATLASWLGFWLFVRFCVFTALCSSVLAGLALDWALARRTAAPGRLAAVLVGVAALLESGHVLRGKAHWGPRMMFYPQLQEMGEFLREAVAPAPVLANFHTSGFILAYGRCPVVLYPKFESPAIRDRVEAFAHTLFREDERTFRDWAAAHGARYFVYGLGEFSPQERVNQMRYMADAIEPPEYAAARLFEFAPERLTLFALVFANEKYRIFRVVHEEDEQQAARWTAAAAQALEEGRPAEAERLAVEALRLHPRHAAARAIFAEAALQREAGVGSRE
jgi:hypothetical protein